MTKMILRDWFVYIVECKDKSLYVGITTDIKKRINAHNSGKGCKYTKSRIPVKLMYSEIYKSKSIALRREAQLKKWTKAKKLALVEKDYIKLKKLNCCK